MKENQIPAPAQAQHSPPARTALELANHFAAHAQRLADALKRIVKDWDNIPEDTQVPGEINIDEHWDEAREALAEWSKQK